jgi:hypothetical protein
VVWAPTQPPNGLELRSPTFFVGSCPAEAGNAPLTLAYNGGPGMRPYPPARRVSISELIASRKVQSQDMGNTLF